MSVGATKAICSSNFCAASLSNSKSLELDDLSSFSTVDFESFFVVIAVSLEVIGLACNAPSITANI